MAKRMGEELVEAMQELLDYSKGKIDLRMSRMPATPVRKMISPTEIKAVRENLKMSQSVFAIVIGVSKKTVESWESGRYKPDGAARRLITIMEKDPMFPEKYSLVERA